MSWKSIGMACLVCLAAGRVSLADTISDWIAPDFDRWMYPFNGSPGIRSLAPTFGAVGEDGFDDFDGEFVLGFNTAGKGLPKLADIPAGMQLKINSVTVTATHFQGAVVYDPTFDDYTSYLPGDNSQHTADADAGRPIELYGAGVRNGYTGFSFNASSAANIGPPLFEEGDLYTLGSPIGENARSVYAFDPDFGSVSNAVSDGLFDSRPFAIGQTNVAPGAVVAQGTPGVSAGSTFAFDLDLDRASVLDYVVDSILENGSLFFTIVSLHPAAEQTGGVNPNFYTRDNFDPHAMAPTLSIDWSLEAIPPMLVGDANGDCTVGAADYAIWAAQFGQTANGLSADFDGNGSVGAGDYALWAANFGKSCDAPGGAGVPEPSTWVLLVLGTLFVAAGRFKRRLRG